MNADEKRSHINLLSGRSTLTGAQTQLLKLEAKPQRSEEEERDLAKLWAPEQAAARLQRALQVANRVAIKYQKTRERTAAWRREEFLQGLVASGQVDQAMLAYLAGGD